MKEAIMKNLLLTLAIGIMAVGQPAQALETPTGSQADYRIRHAIYDANDVVRLDAVIGIATHIIVAPGEEYLTHAFGDPNGWSFAHVGNHFFIKAKATNSDTNLVIVTKKHSYNFALHFIGDYETHDGNGAPVVRQIVTPWLLRNATLQLEFSYPEEEAQTAIEAAHRAAINRRFDGGNGPSNLHYTMSASRRDKEIAPINVWDDSRFTYFRFSPNTDLPNIYTVGTDGSEVIVNRHMLSRPDMPGERVIVAEKVAPKFVLRLGDDVIGIYNERFNPYGLPNTTGTSASSVRRVLNGGDE
jgi:type IV secretion system protein VirB9